MSDRTPFGRLLSIAVETRSKTVLAIESLMAERKFMYDAKKIKGIVVGIIFILVLFAVFIYGAKYGLESPRMAVVKAAEEVQAGEIVDKEIIINPGNIKYGPFDMDHRLIIQREFEYEGKMYKTTASIPVDDETYWKAEIGTWFDSRPLEVNDIDMFESTVSTIPICPNCGAECDTPYCGNCGTQMNQEN